MNLCRVILLREDVTHTIEKQRMATGQQYLHASPVDVICARRRD